MSRSGYATYMQPATTTRARGKHKWLQQHKNLLVLHVNLLSPPGRGSAPSLRRYGYAQLRSQDFIR
jgi:hypothetical protein